MKYSPFLDRSKILMKSWIIFCAAWLILTLLQLACGYKYNGYSALFYKFEKSYDELLWALFCLVLYIGWWLLEIYNCHKAMREYKDFVKSLTKTDEIKQILYKLKVTLFIIMVGLAFSIFAGIMHVFNCMVVIGLMLVKLYYMYKYKTLVGLLKPEERKEVFLEEPVEPTEPDVQEEAN